MRKFVKTSLFLSVLFGILTCTFNAKAMEASQDREDHSPGIQFKSDPFLYELYDKRRMHLTHVGLIAAFLDGRYPPPSEKKDHYKEEEEKLLYGYLNSRGPVIHRYDDEWVGEIRWAIRLGSMSKSRLVDMFSTKFCEALSTSCRSEMDENEKMEVFLKGLQDQSKRSVFELHDIYNAGTAALAAQPSLVRTIDGCREDPAAPAEVSRVVAIEEGKTLTPRLIPSSPIEFKGTKARLSMFYEGRRFWKVEEGQQVTFFCCISDVSTQGKPYCSLDWYQGGSLSETVARATQALVDGENSVGRLVPHGITGLVPVFFNDCTTNETSFQITNIRLAIEPGPGATQSIEDEEGAGAGGRDADLD